MIICVIPSDVPSAAERAREWIEKKARAETERIRAALTHMQESVEQDKAGSADEAERPSGSNTEEEGRGLTTLKAPQQRVVASRPNMAKVVIVRPAPKEHEPERAAMDDEVSPSLIG